MVAIGFDDTYIYANDPNKSSAPRKQAQDKFQKCMKNAFLFWPKKKAEEPKPEPVVETPVVTAPEPVNPVQNGATGTKIVDISKHQGSIDFAALSKEVAFVIARAGCGSDPDVRFDEYAAEMKKYGIPFGVYCYSYAGDEAKARDEAKKLVQRASKYNPLFYVMDAEEEKITNAAIRAFADELKKNGAEKIGCYCAHHRYKQYDYDSLRSLFHFTWIPCYGSNNGTIEGSKKPSYVCDLWQYTSTGKIAGISGNADMNVITGQGKSLEWFIEGYTGEKAPEPEPATPATGRIVMISGGNCNVRTLPNTSGEIIGVAYNGDALEYGGYTESNGWLAVKFKGKDGYVSGKYGWLL